MLNFRRDAYSVIQTAATEAEITMYGEICETQPCDWWTGEPIPGTYIIQDAFLADIEQITQAGIKKITLRMNSLGGDAGVSILIHNRLRELANNGYEISCVVDGVAMSGGSLIMCACDTVTVNPSSLIMIHKAWGTVFGGYNADELRALANTRDAWDKAQVAIYNRKCGLSDTVISHMMADTTYMTGKEAVEKGFADILSEDAGLSIAASADRKAIFVNGKKAMMPYGMKAPETLSIETVEESAETINTNQPDEGVENEGGIQMAQNLAELRAENPALAEQIVNDLRAENEEAVNTASVNERRRIQEIDAIASRFDDETVREAKYGDTPCTAQEMAYRAAVKAANAGTTFLAGMMEDSKASNASEVGAAKAPEETKTTESKEDVKAQALKDVEDFKNKKGVN